MVIALAPDQLPGGDFFTPPLQGYEKKKKKTLQGSPPFHRLARRGYWYFLAVVNAKRYPSHRRGGDVMPYKTTLVGATTVGS